MMDLVVHYVGFGFYTESEGKPLDYSEQRTSQEANIVTWEEKKVVTRTATRAVGMVSGYSETQ